MTGERLQIVRAPVLAYALQTGNESQRLIHGTSRYGIFRTSSAAAPKRADAEAPASRYHGRLTLRLAHVRAVQRDIARLQTHLRFSRFHARGHRLDNLLKMQFGAVGPAFCLRGAIIRRSVLISEPA